MYNPESGILLCFIEPKQFSFFRGFSKATFYLPAKVERVSMCLLKEPPEWESRVAEKVSSDSAIAS